MSQLAMGDSSIPTLLLGEEPISFRSKSSSIMKKYFLTHPLIISHLQKYRSLARLLSQPLSPLHSARFSP